MKNRNKNGFTLAEVLLTLAIIGIIAVLVLPGLTANTQNTALYSQIKETYTVLQSATNQLLYQNNGDLKGAFANASALMDAYASVLSVSKKCNANTQPGECFHDGFNSWKGLTGDPAPFNATGTERLALNNGILMSVRNWGLPNCNSDKFRLSNGTSAACAIFYVDVNGFKSPNVLGRDIQAFEVTRYGLYARGNKAGDDINGWLFSCDETQTGSWNGESCSARVIIEGGFTY